MRALLVIAVAASCGGRAASEVALPDVVTHPVYRVRAQLPPGWVADIGHASIYPADTWTLHPANKPFPVLSLILGWLPRGGRQSAFFPGERDDDSHRETREVGGIRREVTIESGGKTLLVDFEIGELAVSIRGASLDDDSRDVVDAIIAHLVFDPAAKPDPGRPSRRAFELVRGWAASHGYPNDNIVFVGEHQGAFAFTLFHERGLVSLRVDAAVTSVTEMPR